eukprot:2009633-Pleurochrysis_carterae.AAC.2
MKVYLPATGIGASSFGASALAAVERKGSTLAMAAAAAAAGPREADCSLNGICAVFIAALSAAVSV